MDVDVSALMSSLGWWENFEFYACAVVFLGVAGEIVADFTKIVKDEVIKKRFAMASAVALLLGIGGELAGLIKVSILTGDIIVALNQEIISTTRAASIARDAASTAKSAAADAKDYSKQAQMDASRARKDADDERIARIRLQSQTDRLKRQIAYRTLTEEQRAILLSILKPEAPQDLYLVIAPEPESTSFANEISQVLHLAGWNTEFHPSNWGTVEHYPEGVVIMISDVSKPPVGIEIHVMNFPMVGEGKFALFVGLKPKTQN